MNRYPIVQNQPYNSQVHSHPPNNPTPWPSPQYPSLPQLPQLRLSDLVHVGAGLATVVALGAAILGNDEQRKTAGQWLAVTVPVLEATKPTPIIPRVPLPISDRTSVIPTTPTAIVPALVIRPLKELHQQVQQLQNNEAEIRNIIGEACRQLAVTQGELTLLREIVLGDSDESDAP